MRNAKRRLVTGSLAAAMVAAGVGGSVLPASASPRTLIVTLLGGKTMRVTVNVPPGTSLDQIKIPGVPGPVVGVTDITPAPAVTTPTITTPTTTHPTTTTPTSPPRQGPSKPPRKTTKPGAPKAQPKARPKAKAKPKPKKQAGKAKGRPQQGAPPAGTTPGGGLGPRNLPGGAPTPADPSFSLAQPGPAPIGVPDFFIDKFRVPPFLLGIYQAAGTQYGIPWQVLAAINEIETDYGRNLNVSTAGAVGWMQFLPSTFAMYGVDANNDGLKDPYNPVDAIFSAARYLKAAGGDKDIRKAIFAYNHADWYVQSVLLRAKLLGGLPADFVGSLTGLTEGRFPVAAKSTYADDLSERAATARIARSHNVAVPVASDPHRRSVDIFSKDGAPAIAVQDGQVVKIGTNRPLGHYLLLRDAYGNTYTYAHLKSISRTYPTLKPSKESAAQIAHELKLPKADAAPTEAASAGRQATAAPAPRSTSTGADAKSAKPARPRSAAPAVVKERLFAHPYLPEAFRVGGEQQILDMGGSIPASMASDSSTGGVLDLKGRDVVMKRLKVGSQVIGGTLLGKLGQVDKSAPRLTFMVQPAGRGAPQVDPKPLLDGWQLLQASAVYRAAGKNPFWGPGARAASIGQVLLMGKEQLQALVLSDPRVSVYSCGRRDIQAGLIDRRVLAAIEFLADSGMKPTISSLECGHGYLTSSGNVSEHTTGDAVDVAAINGIPVAGHQGRGSITDLAIQRLLTLQGTLKPHQIISLMTYPNADNTLALPDHWDHVHVGYRPLFGAQAAKFDSILKPDQWIKLIDRLGKIDEPSVAPKPSKYALKVTPQDRASSAHQGE